METFVLARSREMEPMIMNHDEYQLAADYWTSKEVNANRMPEAELRSELDAFFKSHNTLALATGWGDYVRCTPLEYTYRAGAFWVFTEGGLKFRGLEHNSNVSLAVFDPYSGFGSINSAQVMGTTVVVDPESLEFEDAAAAKGLTGKTLDKVRSSLHLLKIVPTRIDYLSSALRQRGYDVRQWVDLA